MQGGELLTARARQRQGGQALIAFAIAFTLFIVGTTLMICDIAAIFVASARTDTLAQDAAQAGAADFDLAYFKQSRGGVRLDATAVTACQQSLGRPGGGISVTCTELSATRMQAVVTRQVTLPVGVLGTVTLRATATADVVRGTTTPQ